MVVLLVSLDVLKGETREVGLMGQPLRSFRIRDLRRRFHRASVTPWWARGVCGTPVNQRKLGGAARFIAGARATPAEEVTQRVERGGRVEKEEASDLGP
jgi:hypothetical protein